MNDQEKLECIAESVEMDVSEINPDTVLAEMENWDSVAVLSIISVINEKFNKFPSAAEILKYTTVGDLMNAMQ